MTRNEYIAACVCTVWHPTAVVSDLIAAACHLANALEAQQLAPWQLPARLQPPPTLLRGTVRAVSAWFSDGPWMKIDEQMITHAWLDISPTPPHAWTFLLRVRVPYERRSVALTALYDAHCAARAFRLRMDDRIGEGKVQSLVRTHDERTRSVELEMEIYGIGPLAGAPL